MFFGVLFSPPGTGVLHACPSISACAQRHTAELVVKAGRTLGQRSAGKEERLAAADGDVCSGEEVVQGQSQEESQQEKTGGEEGSAVM